MGYWTVVFLVYKYPGRLKSRGLQILKGNFEAIRKANRRIFYAGGGLRSINLANGYRSVTDH